MKTGNSAHDIGALLVWGVFFLFAVTFVLGTKFPALHLVSNILLGGFIGGFTNTVAIKMLFEKKWYLPGSGVLLKSRDKIVDSLARTVEKHILNTKFMEEWVRDKLLNVNRDDIKAALNGVVEEFKEDVIRYIKTEEVHAKLIKAAEDVVNRMGFIRHMVKLLTSKHDIVNMVTYHISAEIYRFEVSDAMIDAMIEKIGSLEDLLLKPENPLILRRYNSRKAVADYVLGQLNIRQRVVDRLSGYPPEKITRIVEENIREHLVWLEVFGVILGCVFSGMFGGVTYVLSRIP